MSEPQSPHAGRGSQAAALAVGLATALGVAASARAAAPGAFGMVGLARTQTAYLHAVLTRTPDTAHPGCRVTLSFVDARGQVFHDRAGNEVKETFVLRDNVAATLRLRSSDALDAGEPQTLIRGVVSYPPETEGRSDCRTLRVSESIVAQSGRTRLHLEQTEPCPDAPNPPCPGFLSIPETEVR